MTFSWTLKLTSTRREETKAIICIKAFLHYLGEVFHDPPIKTGFNKDLDLSPGLA